MAIIANRIKTEKILPELLGAARSNFSVYFFILLITTSCCMIYMISATSTLRKVVIDSYAIVITPVIETLDACLENISKTGHYFQELSNARYENISLKLENSRLQKLIEQSSRVHSENTLLRSHIKFVDSTPVEYIASARIVDVSLNTYNHSILITAGIKSGVEKNNVIVSNDGIIGKVIDAANNTARAMLITDKQSRIPVISSVSGQRAILSGDGRSGGELLYVGDIEKIKVGETILSSGDGKYYPYGIPVAKVVNKIGNKVYVVPAVNLSQAKFVSIIRTSGD
jgi:rod shape-determining protein MreC